MMLFAPPPLLIVKKPKKYLQRHDSGAWKVAYADFVTAMMALFMVLWLLNGNMDTRKKIGGYFANTTSLAKLQTDARKSAVEPSEIKRSEEMSKLKQELAQALRAEALPGRIEMAVTAEGLRIELVESDQGAFFESGRSHPTRLGRSMISLLGKELRKLPNQLTIEGHTDAKPFADDAAGYGNWELSADRANAARQVMVSSGVDPDQVIQVRGFAGRNLRYPRRPENYSNRRISVIVHFVSPLDEPTLGYPAQRP
jgi:chemotaxis protein MotB